MSYQTQTQFETAVDQVVRNINGSAQALTEVSIDAIQHVKADGSTARVLYIATKLFNHKAQKGGAVYKSFVAWCEASCSAISIKHNEKTDKITATCKGWNKQENWQGIPTVSPLHYVKKTGQSAVIYSLESELKLEEGKLKRIAEGKAVCEDSELIAIWEAKIDMLKQAIAKAKEEEKVLAWQQAYVAA